MFYMVANISSMLNIGWFFGMHICTFIPLTCTNSGQTGIPFNDSVNWRLTIAEQAQSIVGSHLLGLQAGNEPDFYQQYVQFLTKCQATFLKPNSRFGRRETYSPTLYGNELESLITTIDKNPLIPVKNMLLGPSVATGPWTPEQVWETGFIDRFKDKLMALTVEQCVSITSFLVFVQVH